MKKLRLQLDDLHVDTFSTTAAPKTKGTVFGEQCTCYTQCTCPGCPTCDASCGETCASCDPSCGGTCDDLCGTWDESCEAWSCQVSCANYTGIPYAQQCYIC